MEEQHDPDAPEATKHCKVCKSLWFGTDSKMGLRDWEPAMGKANKPSFNKDHSPKCVRLTYPLPKSKPRNCSSRISRLNRDSASVPESSHKLISGTKGMLGASTTAPDPSTPRPTSKRAQSVQPASPPPPPPKRPNVASSPPHKASRQQANRTFTQATIVTSPNSKVYKVQRPPMQPNSKSPAALSSSSPVQRHAQPKSKSPDASSSSSPVRTSENTKQSPSPATRSKSKSPVASSSRSPEMSLPLKQTCLYKQLLASKIKGIGIDISGYAHQPCVNYVMNGVGQLVSSALLPSDSWKHKEQQTQALFAHQRPDGVYV